MTNYEKNHEAKLLLMDMLATLAKQGNAAALPYLKAGAMTIMPDGVAIYRMAKFDEVTKEVLMNSIVGTELKIVRK